MPEFMTPDSLWTTFTALAERVPDVEAIVSPGRQPLRFADLPGRLDRIRRDLAHFGIGRGDRVVSVVPRGPETAVCYLGVAACATYVPLNPDFGAAEFTALLTRLRPAAVEDLRGCAEVLARHRWFEAEAFRFPAINVGPCTYSPRL